MSTDSTMLAAQSAYAAAVNSAFATFNAGAGPTISKIVACNQAVAAAYAAFVQATGAITGPT